ncbi:MAG: TonB-dependent receptor, partial [Acidobacteria bacterium]|nr:TonB-dependent receptor [Acidobacteriota bacterium]
MIQEEIVSMRIEIATRHRLPVMLACLLLAGAVTAVPAMAQAEASTGQIVGTVLDQQKASIPGAEIRVTNPATGLERVTITNEAGLYRAPLLPAGVYSVTATMTGFQGETRTNVQVNVGSTIDVNFMLKVGNISEVVEVSATAGVETTRSETGAIVTADAIRDLPISGRRFHDFITLTPTVQVEPQRGQISFAGQRGINGNISIDGADYNQPFFGGIRGGERANSSFTIPQESIAEFQVVKSGYNAEFGRSTAGLVNAVTKSGTNDIHGSAFYLLRHKELAGSELLREFFPGGISLPTQHQFGGSFGGPIARDKTFFFASFERQDFQRPRAVVYSRLAGYTPKPEGLPAFNFYKAQEGEFVQTNDANAFLVRVDNQFSSTHRMNIRYNMSTNDALNAVATGEAISPFTTRALSTNGTEKDRTQAVIGQLNSIFSPTLINDLRVQYSWEKRPREANAEAPNVATYVGEYGSRSFLPTTQSDYRIQATDSLAWVKGRHTFKFGSNSTTCSVDQTFGFNQFGGFSISGSSVDTALALVSGAPNKFDSTAVTYRLQLGNLLLEDTRDDLAFFAQDTWRVTNRLTLNFGLRYEAIFNPDPDVSNSILLNRVKGVPLAFGSTDPSVIPDNTDQWAPRFGFAWDPFGRSKTVIRGHAGMYYAATPFLLFAGPLNNFREPPGDLSVQLPFTPKAGDTRNTVYR